MTRPVTQPGSAVRTVPDGPAGCRHRPCQLTPVVGRLLHARSRRRARRAAALLDRLVDRNLELVRVLPAHRQAKPVERLAGMVMLAQANRHYAAGWIDRGQLQQKMTELAVSAAADTTGRAG